MINVFFIQNNIPIGNVQIFKADLADIPKCECRPDMEQPCTIQSDCINAMLMYECHPQVGFPFKKYTK